MKYSHKQGRPKILFLQYNGIKEDESEDRTGFLLLMDLKHRAEASKHRLSDITDGKIPHLCVFGRAVAPTAVCKYRKSDHLYLTEERKLDVKVKQLEYSSL